MSPDSTRVVFCGDVLAAGVVELFSGPLAGGASVRLSADLVAAGDVVAEAACIVCPA